MSNRHDTTLANVFVCLCVFISLWDPFDDTTLKAFLFSAGLSVRGNVFTKLKGTVWRVCWREGPLSLSPPQGGAAGPGEAAGPGGRGPPHPGGHRFRRPSGWGEHTVHPSTAARSSVHHASDESVYSTVPFFHPPNLPTSIPCYPSIHPSKHLFIPHGTSAYPSSTLSLSRHNGRVSSVYISSAIGRLFCCQFLKATRHVFSSGDRENIGQFPEGFVQPFSLKEIVCVGKLSISL